MTRTVVWLDIDGTLLHAHGSGRAAFARALQAVHGWEDDLAYIHFAGATDLDVYERVLRRHGAAPDPERTAAFLARLPMELAAALAGNPPTVFPGVRELLAALRADPRAVVGWITGNLAACARIKLEAAGLYGPAELGAFGDEHADRREIARRAMARARAHLGADGGALRAALLGDTPADIAAARAIGARAVAVATGGRHSADDLRAAGADAVFNDLRDLPAVLAALGV